MPPAPVASPSASATRPSRKLPVADRGRARLVAVASRRPPRRRVRSRPRASAEESGSRTTHAVPVPLSPDDALASVRAATVVVAPHAAKTQLPFLRSSRRGSGVVVSLDGAGGDLRVLTAAHVACLAGPDNRVDVRASDAANAPTRVGSVVAVHPRLDLALIALDDVAPSVSDIATSRKRDAPDDGKEKDVFPSTFAPLAAAPPPVGARVAALGYAMGWSSAFRTAMRRRDDAAAGVWGELLATHAEGFRDEDDERFSGTDRDDETDEKTRVAAFALHTASVASGCSGGPLVSERGEVIGVHSFGDAFYGGARDVAVATPRDLVQRLGAFGTENETPRAKPASPETYATATVLASVFASSDPALAAMCPELTPERRKAWIL